MSKLERMEKSSRRIGCIWSHLRPRKSSPEIGRVGKNQTRARERRTFTREDILDARETGKCMIVIHKKVYDVTEFLEEHPGGAEIITDIDWEDFETMNFEFDDAEHSDEALEDMREFYCGRFVDEDEDDDDDDGDDDDENAEEEEYEASDDEDSESKEEISVVESDDGSKNMLTPFARLQELELPLVGKHHISHDVCVFRFGLPSEEHLLGLPIGQHIILGFHTQDGQSVTRPYTPVSPRGEVGFVDFLVKLYPTGKMSNHLAHLAIGDKVRMRGPKGKLEYHGQGHFTVRKKKRQIRRLGMVAGGSGITPMFQILQSVARDHAQDDLEISLLFANKTEDDIILRESLEAFSQQHPGRIRVHFTLDSPPQGWEHYSGFISLEMLRETMPTPQKDTMVLLCGPTPMIKKACLPNLQALGFTRDHIFKF